MASETIMGKVTKAAYEKGRVDMAAFKDARYRDLLTAAEKMINRNFVWIAIGLRTDLEALRDALAGVRER